MRSRNTYSVFTVFTALLIVVLGAGVAFGQGKGRGGDKGGGDKRGGGQADQSRGQNKRDDREQRQDRPQAQREQRQDRPQAQREQRQDRPQVQREQQRQDRPQAQREQQRQDRPQAQREQQRQDRPQAQRDQQRQEVQREQYKQWPNRVERDDDRDDSRRGRRDDRNSRRQVEQAAPWNNGWPNNYGAQRSREVHERNAARKAWKSEERELRRYRSYDRSNDSRYQPYLSTTPAARYYVNDPYTNQYQTYPVHQRANILRSVISMVFGSNSGYGDNYYPQNQISYGYNTYDQGYYGGSRYSDYPQYQYQSYAAEPYYYSYQPYSDIYYPQNSGDQYSQNGYMGYMQPGYYSDSSLGGGYAPQQYSSLLALGYDQGYNDGLAARRAGYSDQYYSDPYAYENSNYVPYSYSVGTNRRSLSDGYELGYDDAYYDQRGNDSYQNGNFDLVSMLISTALQMF
ncbi:MAG: hypothetical protein KA746_09790 [Pyrinomonadaceae bacterium]|nr:hypothetical protein [Pyrinomonadaceae bacterium]MBP6212050.1 hypothetical protein [Pyrinomonadaceae bacterium]